MLDATEVYVAADRAGCRIYLQGNTRGLRGGSTEGTGVNFNHAVGLAARFPLLTAIAVDLDYDEAMVVVVGDGNAVRSLDVYTRAVRHLGGVGMVTSVGGIPLRRDPATAARPAHGPAAANHSLLVSTTHTTHPRSTPLLG